MSDREIVLERGGLRACVSSFGASLRGLWREAAGGAITDIVTGYSGRENKVGGQGDVLIPFPGRVKGGAYPFGGEAFQMARNDKDGPNAIHGFVRQKDWMTVRQDGSAATFATVVTGDAPGYPFALHVVVSYTLSASSLQCDFSITNTGARPAPVAAGFHPYFTVGDTLIDDALLTVPFDSVLEFDAGLIPTGNILPVADTSLDFRTPRPVGQTVFNTCYQSPAPDADGVTRVRLASPDNRRTITVWMDDAFNSVVLYSGDPLPASHRRRALAIEPMTCGSDAFNHPEWGLRTLAPAATFSGAWGVSTT